MRIHNNTVMWGGAGTIPVALNFGGGAPGPSATQKENDTLNNALLRKQLAEANKKKKEAPDFKIPAAPVYASPPSSTSADAEAATRESYLASLRRRGLQQTIIANRSTTLGAS